MIDIAANLAHVQERIYAAARRAQRDPAEITLVAVTKTVPLETIQAAYALGLRHLGENRVQEATEKISRFQFPSPPPDSRTASEPETWNVKPGTWNVKPVHWHLIGHLQTNKAKTAARLFDLIQSVDSLALARTLDTHCRKIDKRLPILLQVNVSGESSKSGFRVDDSFWAAVPLILVLPNLEVQGLMTVAPQVTDPEDVRPVLRQLRGLRDALRRRYPAWPWSHLSMGMSDDFEVAIEEGATIIRLGRAIFGERKC